MSPTDVVSQEKITAARTKVINDFTIQVATVNGSGAKPPTWSSSVPSC